MNCAVELAEHFVHFARSVRSHVDTGGEYLVGACEHYNADVGSCFSLGDGSRELLHHRYVDDIQRGIVKSDASNGDVKMDRDAIWRGRSHSGRGYRKEWEQWSASRIGAGPALSVTQPFRCPYGAR